MSTTDRTYRTWCRMMTCHHWLHASLTALESHHGLIATDRTDTVTRRSEAASAKAKARFSIISAPLTAVALHLTLILIPSVHHNLYSAPSVVSLMTGVLGTGQALAQASGRS